MIEVPFEMLEKEDLAKEVAVQNIVIEERVSFKPLTMLIIGEQPVDFLFQT